MEVPHSWHQAGQNAGSAFREAAEEISRRTIDNLAASFSGVSGAFESAASDMTKPHVLMRPQVFMDGNSWIALYGENIQEGVTGCGDSPYLACVDFDRHWLYSQKQIDLQDAAQKMAADLAKPQNGLGIKS